MCHRKMVTAAVLTATIGRQALGRASSRSAPGARSRRMPSWKTASAAIAGVVGNMFDSSPVVATIDRG
jgi:hypothetical protein